MEIITAQQLKSLPELGEQLGFGQYFTDHMFIAYYRDGKWDQGRIQPFQPLQFHPAATCLHYAQEVFEGMKAYRGIDGALRLFRYQDNIQRMELSCERLCMPKMDRQLFTDGLIQLLKLDGRWALPDNSAALYIRPYMLGIDHKLGVHPASEYMFVIILSPVGAYFPREYTKIRIEDHYQRVATQGTGNAKTGGNYAASLLASRNAQQAGFDQVLWLDANASKYIEEVGAMNICFIIDNKLVTPQLNTSILDGITRRSVIKVAKQLGITVEERLISIDELVETYHQERLTEAFGVGTASVVSKIGTLAYQDLTMELKALPNSIAEQLKAEITGIQYGRKSDPANWITIVEEN